MNNQWSRVEALVGTGFQSLTQLKVGVVGLGSLGSLTTVQLAMSGIKNFVLIDPDILEEHNVVRHAADLRYVGYPKVEAVKDLILNRNSDAQVEAVHANVFDSLEHLYNVDLVLVAGLGSEIATTNLAIKLRELQKIVIFGGVYEKAVAGEIFVVFPQSGPCYSCFASKLRSIGEDISIKEVDYGMPVDELRAQPGLSSHINRVASVFADWVIRIAIHDVSILPRFPGNLVILSNEEYTLGNDAEGHLVTIPPSSSRWFRMKQLDDCNICNLSEDMSKSISELLKEMEHGNFSSE